MVSAKATISSAGLPWSDVDALFGRKLGGLVQESPIVLVELMQERRCEVAEAAMRRGVDNRRDVDDECLCVLFGREVKPELERLVGRGRTIGSDENPLHGSSFRVLFRPAMVRPGPESASGRAPIRRAENYGFIAASIGLRTGSRRSCPRPEFVAIRDGIAVGLGDHR
jgi:hypothetical protein